MDGLLLLIFFKYLLNDIIYLYNLIIELCMYM